MTRFEQPDLKNGSLNNSPDAEDHEFSSGEDDGIRIPKIFWAALLVFSINLMIVIWFYFSPGFTVRLGAFHPEQTSLTAEAKPSVFTEVVDETRRPLKAAMKVRPVVYDIPALNPQQQLDVPARSIAAAYEPPMPRATTPPMPRRSQPAMLDIPKASEPQLRHATSIEVRPHSEPPRLIQ